MVCPSVCLLSQFSFNVPIVALNSVTLDAVLSYKSCSPHMICLNFLYNVDSLFFFLHIFHQERVIPRFHKFIDFLCCIVMFHIMKVDVNILHICLNLFDPFRRLFFLKLM